MSRRTAPAMELSQRDQALLEDVGRLRFAGADQLLRLHFTTGAPVGRQRHGQAALRRLTTDGYLHRLPRRIGGHASGSSRFVYELGYRGQLIVWPERPARTPDQTGRMFVLHSLAIGTLVVGLVEAQRREACSGLGIDTEPTVWRRYVGPHGRPLILKPDLGVRLVIDNTEHVWLVEVDRATEAPKRIRRKAGQYLEYWRTGIDQDRIGTFPKVLWSVPDDRRASSISRALDGLPDPAAAMFPVTTQDRTLDLLLGRGPPSPGAAEAKEQQVIEGGE